ncbi:phosphotransferase [Actinocrispum sp. NPDC049592]|uniref:phosphotransferase n=1 Tax=Actinocrispum sp. NPDC049592 TaxID=3154835 RepID=UPI003412BCDA
MISEEKLRSCLVNRWAITGATVKTHNAGMNSATWFVTAGSDRWVAKAVTPDSRRAFLGGLTIAGQVEAAGIPAGAPLPTREGDIVVDVDGVPLTLLNWVDGEELSGSTAQDQRLIGRTLGGVHEALRDVSAPLADQFHWIDTQDPFVGSARRRGSCGSL